MDFEEDIPEYDPTGSYALGVEEAQAVVEALEALPGWFFDEVKGDAIIRRIARVCKREVGRDVIAVAGAY
jgi:hypothetical protein